MRYTPELVQFLQNSEKELIKAKKSSEVLNRVVPEPSKFTSSKKPSKTIHEIMNVKGSVELKMDPAIRKMARELSKLLTKVKPLEEEASGICKEMTGLMSKLVGCFDKLSITTGAIHKVYQKVASKFDFDHFTRVSELYLGLNNTFSEWKKIYKTNHDSFFKNIRMIFAVSSQEEKGLEKVKNLLTSSW